MTLIATVRAVALAAAVSVTVCAAHADTHILARAGVWESFGGTTSNGQPVCGMSSSPAGRYFGLKHFSGNQTFTIQLGASTWDLTNGSKQKLTLRFDRHSIWRATGTGMHFNDGDAGLEFTVNRKELANFVREFSTSDHLNIQYAGAHLQPWSLSLKGTKTVRETFESCNDKL